MAEWRFARGWTDAELRDRLASAATLPRSFVAHDDDLTPDRGWSWHASEAVIAAEGPGPPERGGPFERAWPLVAGYSFSDPRIVNGHFDRDRPLKGRRMLLEARVLWLHYLGAVVVSAVRDDATAGQTVRGFRYDTLRGHFEHGSEWFVLTKDHATGAVTFRIRAAWRRGDLPNTWSRVGFNLVAQRYQRAWHRLAYLRLRSLLGSSGLQPLPPPRRLVHAGPALPTPPVQAVAGTRRPAHVDTEDETPAAGFTGGRMIDLVTPTVLGIVTGGRSMLGPALAAHVIARRDPTAEPPGAGRILSSPAARRILPVLAAAEIAADKSALMPARTAWGPLAGRVCNGALAGAAVASAANRRYGAVLAGAGALASSFALFRLRRLATARAGAPPALAGLCEDAVLLTTGLLAVRRARRVRC